jgi:hypothetical protein
LPCVLPEGNKALLLLKMSSFSEFLASSRRGGPAAAAADITRHDDDDGCSKKKKKVYFRVVHAFVWVRAACALDAEIVGRKFRGQTLCCCVEGSRLWAELVGGGFVLVDGAALGLGPLLERITIREHEAALAAAKEQRRATEAKIEVCLAPKEQCVTVFTGGRGCLVVAVAC